LCCNSIIAESRTTKARLLNYFPQSQATAEREWCGWHNDHGALTALTTAMYINSNGEQVPAPDTRAGLAAAPRNSAQQLKVNIPADHIAYQIGI
jgi:isopenicillin N synthase-like dioxygenase